MEFSYHFQALTFEVLIFCSPKLSKLLWTFFYHVTQFIWYLSLDQDEIQYALLSSSQGWILEKSDQTYHPVDTPIILQKGFNNNFFASLILPSMKAS